MNIFKRLWRKQNNEIPCLAKAMNGQASEKPAAVSIGAGLNLAETASAQKEKSVKNNPPGRAAKAQAKPTASPSPLPQNPKLRHGQLCHDLKQVLKTGEGQRYLARLIALSGAFGSSYSPAGPEASAYNEGLRRMGLFILAEVQKYAPEALPRLLSLCLPSTAPLQ